MYQSYRSVVVTLRHSLKEHCIQKARMMTADIVDELTEDAAVAFLLMGSCHDRGDPKRSHYSNISWSIARHVCEERRRGGGERKK